jgi:hypothetical protein
MQNVGADATPAQVQKSLPFRAGKLARRTTIYAIRKLLP